MTIGPCDHNIISEHLVMLINMFEHLKKIITINIYIYISVQISCKLCIYNRILHRLGMHMVLSHLKEDDLTKNEFML